MEKSLDQAADDMLEELKQNGLQIPWLCDACGGRNATAIGSCAHCVTPNPKYAAAFENLPPRERDHPLLLVALVYGPRQLEGALVLRDAMACEQDGRLQEATQHFRKAFKLWPELDSALHSDGVPAALRQEADAMTRPLGQLEEKVLGKKCWLALSDLGLVEGEFDSASSRCMQRLWTGMGYVCRLSLSPASGKGVAVIAKMISLPDRPDESHERDLESYRIEGNFYEKGHAGRLNLAGATCPHGLGVDRSRPRRITLCMSEIPGDHSRRLNQPQAYAALAWLARLHSTYWGPERASAAVADGLHENGCFWCLDSRRAELASLPAVGLKGRLKLAAEGIDERLKADCMQTICHGDAKAANMLFDDAGDVGFVDFQWVGRASAAKDLAYCLMCGYPDDLEEMEEKYLRLYHGRLSVFLRSAGEVEPSLEQVRDSYRLAACDLARFQCGAGWFGNVWWLKATAEKLLDQLDGGALLASEGAYREAIFSAFPV